MFRLNTNPFAVVREGIYPYLLNDPCNVGTCKTDGILIPVIPARKLGVHSTTIYINQVHAR